MEVRNRLCCNLGSFAQEAFDGTLIPGHSQLRSALQQDNMAALKPWLSSVRVRWRSLSSASEELEMSSRRKIAGCEYSEWTISCRSWETSV